MSDKREKYECPNCHAGPMNAETLYVHQCVHNMPWSPSVHEPTLGSLPFALMPQVSKMLRWFTFGFIEWLLPRVAAMDVACLTGDCDHEDQEGCVRFIYDEFLRDEIGHD